MESKKLMFYSNINLAFWLIISFLILIFGLTYSKSQELEKDICQEMILDLIVTDTNKIDLKITDWHKFIDAVMHVE